MESTNFIVDQRRIDAFLATHPDVSPVATNEPIGESSFHIPVVYEADEREHVVYFEDQGWEEENLHRLLEWTLALRFFSARNRAEVHVEGVEPTPLVAEIISLEPVVVAKLTAILGLLIADDDTPETLVAVARRWFQELFDISWPESAPSEEEQKVVDQTVLMLNQLIEEFFWANNRWSFHPLEYILLLGAAFGDLVRLRFGGEWQSAEHPVDATLKVMGVMDFSPFGAVVQMLEEGPAASIWDQYRSLPIAWAQTQMADEEDTESGPAEE